MELKELLMFMTKKGASDLHIKPMRPPLLRIQGRLIPIKADPLQPEDVEKMLGEILNPGQRARFEKRQAVDMGYGVPGVARFRCNIYMQRGTMAGVFRRVPFNIQTIDELNLPEIIETFTAYPSGLLLVTGPTGSGKSTTLYSALSEMESDELNVSTVEDPVEYNLEFCNQVQVIEKIGLTFAASLRSLLRQDPDIIMIGEIRDNETARISVQAALTGHLVLSTLHTNDAPSSISRLVNIGIEPYLIAASLNGILAQRLVRRICTHCKEPYKISGNMQQHVEAAGIDIKTIVHGAGCDECRGTGYAGRAGIFELMIIDDVFRDIINKDSSVNSMRLAFRESKQPSLFDDGMEKVQQGLTTVEEVLRVTQVYGQTEDEAFVENLGEDRKGKSGSGMTKDKKAAKAAKKSQPVMVTEELLHDVDDIDPAATDTEK
ncbi:MAG: type II/IV secretion system protein [Planctomycetes bacterium]|nr:type II/IV secretion system protein [Planctomycetota bacterium]